MKHRIKVDMYRPFLAGGSDLCDGDSDAGCSAGTVWPPTCVPFATNFIKSALRTNNFMNSRLMFWRNIAEEPSCGNVRLDYVRV